MYNKYSYKSSKDNPWIQSQKRLSVSSDDPRVRVLQYNLVFVNGLPSEIASLDILSDQLHFGRYGRVIKSILNPSSPYKKGVHYQAYATYESELDASLAIVALHGITVFDRPLKVSYGTTKYCTYFLKGRQCTNDDCFYLHEIHKQNQVINGDPKSIFKNQNLRAIKMVTDNIEEIIRRMFDNQSQNIDEGFPTLGETVDFLIDNEYLDEKKYFEIENKIKSQRSIKNSQNKNIQEDLKNYKINEEAVNFDEAPKLFKSNSFSTMASPNKPEASIQFDEEDTIEPEIKLNQRLFSDDKINQTLQFEDRTVCSDNENNKAYQTAFDFDEKVEQKISHKIIQQIMNKKSQKSKFDFVKIDLKNTQTADEIKRVKNIIQRLLITIQ